MILIYLNINMNLLPVALEQLKQFRMKLKKTQYIILNKIIKNKVIQIFKVVKILYSLINTETKEAVAKIVQFSPQKVF